MNNNGFFTKANIGLLLGVLSIFLFLINSILNFIFRNSIYSTKELFEYYLTNDICCIIILLLLLILLLFLKIYNKKNIIILIISGVLLFILYNNISYIISIKIILTIIINLVIIVLSLLSLFLMIRFNYGYLIKLQISIISSRIISIFLFIFGLLFLLRAIYNLINFLFLNKTIPLTEFSLNISDLIISTFWIISSVLLFLKNKYGFIMSFISLIQGSLLFIGLMLYLVLKPILMKSNLIISDIIIISIMLLIYFIPLIICIINLKKSNKNLSVIK